MNFEKEFEDFRQIGIQLANHDFNESIKDVLDYIVSVETYLWRKRINIEHKLGKK